MQDARCIESVAALHHTTVILNEVKDLSSFDLTRYRQQTCGDANERFFAALRTTTIRKT
jgi:hypothetical protein